MSDPLQRLLEAAAGQKRPWLEFLGRRWSPAEVVAEAVRVAAGLRWLGLLPGQGLGLLLPNLPVAVTALLAAWQAGLVAQLADPRQPPAALAAWQARSRPAAVVTLDLATVFERARPLLDDAALRHVILAPMGPQLSPLKRLLSPWLRAGGTVRPSFDARFVAWDRLDGAAPAAVHSGDAPALLLPDGTAFTRAEVAALAGTLQAAQRLLLALPLASRPALGALLASLAAGGTLVLSPRLDGRALAKVAKASGTTALVQ
jgi:long-chain acyl-CoA synthetase